MAGIIEYNNWTEQAPEVFQGLGIVQGNSEDSTGLYRWNPTYHSPTTTGGWAVGSDIQNVTNGLDSMRGVSMVITHTCVFVNVSMESNIGLTSL